MSRPEEGAAGSGGEEETASKPVSIGFTAGMDET
jgi:hypothetical protein